MKKIALALICCLLLTGCGGKPTEISNEMYDTAVYVIKVVDLYMDGEAELEETYNKVDSLPVPEYTLENPDEVSVGCAISAVRTTLFVMRMPTGSKTISDLKEARNKLAKAINY